MTSLVSAPSLEGGKTGWQPIETAPKDGSHFLAWCVDTVSEFDEDDTLIAKDVPEAYAVVAYQIEWLGGIVQFPWTGSIVRNRIFTHWMPLPEPPRAA
jgi:hypothetical protein